MTDLRKAAEVALEALIEDVMVEVEPNVWEYKSIVAIQALRQALGTEQEGCAQCGKQASQGWALYCVECAGGQEWVGLTDEEIQAERHKVDPTAGWTYDHFARAIEAKLRGKNT